MVEVESVEGDSERSWSTLVRPAPGTDDSEDGDRAALAARAEGEGDPGGGSGEAPPPAAPPASLDPDPDAVRPPPGGWLTVAVFHVLWSEACVKVNLPTLSFYY
jgi:hypothetical protein